MGGQSCSSDSSDEMFQQVHRTGVDGSELLTVKNAQLFLVDEDESVPMQRGEFKLILNKQQHSPLAALLATVKDVEWPIGRDCPVIKLGPGCYSFCLPGILYGLVLDSDSTTSDSLTRLDLFLMQYSTFEDHSDDVQGSDKEESQRGFWNEVAIKVEMICERLAWNADLNQQPSHDSDRSSSRKQSPVGTDVSISPRMMKRVQQARRLSAIAKLFSRALVKGAISNLRHVTNNYRARARRAGDLYHQTPVPAAAAAAVASVDAFAKVVEAVESPSKSQVHSLPPDQHQQEQQEKIESAWTLNKSGLELLVKAVAASTAINMSSRTSDQRPVASVKPHRPPLPAAMCHGSSKFPGFLRPVQQQRQDREQSHAD